MTLCFNERNDINVIFVCLRFTILNIVWGYDDEDK